MMRSDQWTLEILSRRTNASRLYVKHTARRFREVESSEPILVVTDDIK